MKQTKQLRDGVRRLQGKVGQLPKSKREPKPKACGR
jgi:hypothetical protein